MSNFENIILKHKEVITCSLFLLNLILGLKYYPILIELLKRKKLIDTPNERKKHSSPIPSSGGVLFALGFILCLPILLIDFHNLIFIGFSITILTLGFIDDIKDLSAKKKFLIQIVIALGTIWATGPIQIISEITGFESESLLNTITLLFIVGFMNSFNLMDGIDGLAGSYSFVLFIIFGIVFFILGNSVFGIYSFSLSGIILAFLKFNFNPAKIFMGDTGSLFIGYTCSLFTIIIVNSVSNAVSSRIPIIIFSLLLLPVIDTLRVMIMRIIRKRSPFKPDRTHLHHLILKLGLNIKQASFCILLFNLVLVINGVYMFYAGKTMLIILLNVSCLTICIMNLLIMIRILLLIKKRKIHEDKLGSITMKNQLLLKIN